MKLLVNHKSVIFGLLTLLIIIGGASITIPADGDVPEEPKFTPVSERTQQVKDAIVATVPGVNRAEDVTATHLAAITSLSLANKGITSLKAGDFDGFTSLLVIDLNNNSISNIPDLEALTSLRSLYLSNNSISDISALEALTSLRSLYLDNNSISDISALDGLTLLIYLSLNNNSISNIPDLDDLTSLKYLLLNNNSISDISALDDLTSLTELRLNNNSISDISALDGLTSLAALYLNNNSINNISALDDLTSLATLYLNNNSISDISALEDLTSLKYLLMNSNSISDISALEDLTSLLAIDLNNNSISDVSALEGLTSLAGLYVKGNPISDYGPLHRLKAAIEAANNSIYIDISLVNNAPVFTDGTSTTRSIAENTASGQNIGAAVAATDADNDTLQYTLTGTDASSFSIVSTSGQLQTNAALNYESKTSYSVTVSVSDNNGGSDSIAVTIDVTNVNEAPVFTDGATATRSVAENTAAGQNIGSAVAATDVDSNTTLIYTLSGDDAASFSIVSTSGQLQTKAALDYETDTSYSVTITVSDGSLEDSINVTIDVTDVNEAAPVFTDGTTTSRSVAENTAAGQNIGGAVAATDADTSEVLVYTLSGDDAASFDIVRTSGQLQTKAALDYETDTSYSVTITVSDGSLTDNIEVTINVTNVNEAAPVFTDGVTATRSVAENTAANTNIGAAFAATDADADTTLVYTLGGDDAASFSVVRTSGQLQTKAALNYETDTSYSVTITVSDGSLTDDIDVTIDVTNVNEAPTFTDGTTTSRSVAENTAAGQNIGSPVAATDVDADTTLVYTLGGDDASSFSIVSTSGQLQTNASLDYETDTSYSVTITVSDNSLTDRIDVTINVTDVSENGDPVFSDGTSTTRSVAENTAAGQNIGDAVAATDSDTEDILVYTLGGDDAASFSIVGTSGQLQTNEALNYESKTSYSVTVSVSDNKGGSDSIDVTIDVTNVNEAPTFTEGSTTNRSVAENTAANTNIGDAVAATDVDADTTLVYTLSGDDASFFSIVSTSGQLQTKAVLDYETTTSYSVTITASDGSLEDSINVTIDVTDVNEAAPVFTDGTTTSRSVAENTAANTNIGTPVAATDADTGAVLEYTLGGDDAASFSMVGTSGQLQTKAALNYETDTSYSVTITVSDGSLEDSIDVTIDVTNVNEAAPVFTDGTTATRSVAENTAAGQNIGAALAATDADTGDVLVYTLGGDDAASFSVVSTSGQLQTKAALNYETTTSYSVTITVSDGSLTDDIDVTIDVTNVNEAPVFTDGDSTSRSVAENTVSGTNIGDAVAATDVDGGTTLDYTLSGDDAASFSVVSTSGQLQTKAALDYETDTSYSVTITVSDGSLTDNIDVTIDVTNVNEAAPVFTDGTTTNRSVAENTASNTNIGDPVAATDADTGDVLVYTLGGDDAASFSIVGTSGQLRTNAALDYETDTSYSVTITVSDGSLTDNIDVTIDVTNVNEAAPVFTDGATATRSVAENTAANTNIGAAFAATDADTGDVLVYTLGGDDAASFSIVSTSGQLQTKASLNYETTTSYSVTITVSDGSLTDAIDVTIDVTNVNEAPVFTDGDSTSRSVAENTAAGQNIGDAIAATDVDGGTTLVYTLSGTDASSFSVVSTSGQLQTKAALDYETTTSYSVTITVSDGSLEDSINVTVDVTDVNETPANNAPVFTGTSTTRSVAENTASGQNIGAAVAATDADNDTLVYTLSGTDASSFSIVSTSGQLQTNAALNYESKTSYSVIVSVSDNNGGSDNIDVTIDVTNVNEAPVFTDGTTTNRSVAENTAAGQNIGDAVAATDVDGGTTLVYTLSGDDAASFSMVGTSGQLQTKAALDYETDTSYSVTITVSDGSLTDNIDVTIDVTNVNEAAPVFTDGTTTNRSVAENTASNTNIGDPVAATDADTGDVLVYTLGGDDAASFSIVGTSGQLRTNAALDYETDTSYSVTITVSDGSLTDNIDVTIDVTNVNEAAPVFTDGATATRSVAENTAAGQNIGAAFAATDADTGDVLVYTLGGDDAASFSVVRTSGQLQTKAALNYETTTSYSVTITVSDGSLTDAIDVTIDVTNVNEAPVFTDGDSTSRSVAENTAAGQNIGDAVAATDVDTGTTLVYTLSGDDAASFSIVSTSGQLQTKAALDYEADTSYSVTITASDGSLTDNIDVTIDVTNVNEAAPVFTDGATTTRSVAENTAAGQNIGDAVAATDADTGDVLVYTLGGDDAASFDIVSTSGQLQTSAALVYGTKNAYSVTVNVSDQNGGTDSIDVTINVIQAFVPVSQRTQQVKDAIVAAVPDVNNADDVTATHVAAISTLDLTNKGITQVKAGDFSGFTSLTSLILGDNSISDISPLAPLANFNTLWFLSLNGNSISDISPLANFTSLTVLYLNNNWIYDFSVVDNLTSLSVYFVAGNPILDYTPFTRKSAQPSDILLSNNLPVFSDGSSTSRSVAENTASSTNIGAAIAATDADSTHTLTYSLGGTDAASFSIVSSSGQLQTKAALDYETKSSYSVTVTAYDGNSGADRITVTIDVTDVTETPNNAPVFRDGTSTTRFVTENTAAGQNIGHPVAATDADPGDTLIYTLTGTNASSFSIVSTSGQLQTSAALVYATKNAYSVTVNVSDQNGGTDSIDVTIDVIQAFVPVSQRTQQVKDAIVAAVPGVNDANDVTATHVAAISTLDLTNKGITQVKAGDFSGFTSLTSLILGDNSINDISPLAPLANFNTLWFLSLNGNSISDISPLANFTSLSVLSLNNNWIYDFSVVDNLTSLSVYFVAGNPILDYTPFTRKSAQPSDILLSNNLPVFSDGSSTSRSVAENTASSTNIGAAIAATDADSTHTLTYSLGGTDAASFSIVSSSGQLQTKAALDYETKSSYSVTVTAYDGNSGADRISVTIDVTNVNEKPSFPPDRVILTVAENTKSNTNIGDPITATDPDNGDTLTYSLQRDDAGSFSIDANTGQVKTRVALDYEMKNSYTNLAVRAVDSGGLITSILLTINVTDVANDAPSLETPPIIPDNTDLLTNFPNPFNPETWIPYQLAKPAEVTLIIYNMRGVVVRTIALGHKAAGLYTNRSRAIHWDGRNSIGEKVATGVYFYTLKAGDFTATRKMLIRK